MLLARCTVVGCTDCISLWYLISLSLFWLFPAYIAARIESTGERNRVHLSEETAILLREAGKGHWIKARRQKVVAKGKGELQTYWLQHKSDVEVMENSIAEMGNNSKEAMGTNSEAANGSSLDRIYEQRLDEVRNSPKIQRLIGWNVDVLFRILKKVVASRNRPVSAHGGQVRRLEAEIGRDSSVLDEMTEFVELHHTIDSHTGGFNVKDNQVDISEEAKEQLREYSKCHHAHHFSF